ncbi:MAG: recombination regulator RecX [Pseudomonadota bacterium]|nr:recombination regulator RecX [Pseudomonadota bacterium]
MVTRTLRAQAIRLLARREYARAELETRLVGAGASPTEVRSTLDDLSAQGLLSNQRFARAVVVQKAGRFSRRSIARGLKAKGVAADEIDEALREADLDDDAALTSLWQRRFGQPPADDREKARQVRYLQARGFSLLAILKLLRTAAE